MVRVRVRYRVNDMVRVGKVFSVTAFFYLSVQCGGWGQRVEMFPYLFSVY